jgi:hypothetical protein
MARQPTGTPRGKHQGSGRLTPTQTVAETQIKVTVWLPTVLYDRLEALAVGRHFHRGSSQLARCVREALEEYLDRHSNQQRENIPLARRHKTRQTHKMTAVAHEKDRACASTRVAEAQDLWTEPRAGAAPQQDAAPPAPQEGGEPWSRQAVVARILRWRQEGLTKTAIAARLNAAHVPPLAGTGRWNLRKVTRALWEVPKSKRERYAFLARYAPTNPPVLGREG